MLGMEKKSEVYGLKFDLSLLRALDKVARQQERTRADIIRRACRAYIAQQMGQTIAQRVRHKKVR